MKNCKHDFDFKIGVAIFEDKPGQGSIDISANCKHCGLPLIFYGQRGGGGNEPMASVDRTELRAPVTFGYEPKFIPGPHAEFHGPEIKPITH